MTIYPNLEKETIVSSFQLTNEEIQALLASTKKNSIQEALQDVIKEKILSLSEGKI